MWFDVYTQGILIGLVASIPLGPIGLLCIQRTLSKSHRSGFVSGLGAATADSMFATVALFAALGISHEGIPLGGGMSMILGVLCGASLWWFTLTFGVSFLRRKFRPRHLLWMNRISGSVIVVLGAAAILSIFFHTPVVHEMLP